MGNGTLSTPKIHLNTWSNKVLNAGGASLQCYRLQMEDFEYHQNNFVFPTWNFYMVLDGHGGTQCASQVKEKLPGILSNLIQDDFAKEFEEHKEPNDDELKIAIHKAFKKTDEILREIVQDNSGCCCLILLTTSTKNIIAWCGDCALFSIKNDFSVSRITQDHEPKLQKELERIEAADYSVHNGRIDGNLNVSRCFGDFFLKPLKRERTIIKEGRKRSVETILLTADTFPVICVPDILILDKNKEDLAFLLCSDGLLKVSYNDGEMEWINALKARYIEGYTKPHQLASFIVDYAFSKNAFDNVIVSLVFFEKSTEGKNLDDSYESYLKNRKELLLGCTCSQEDFCQSCFENENQEKDIHVIE
jgi:serine/threonine protein phosphatase PrpC